MIPFRGASRYQDPARPAVAFHAQKLSWKSHIRVYSVTIAVQDDDPYVRKTAAVCVAKLHDINAELVEDRGFLDTLKVKITPHAPTCGFPLIH